MKEKSELIEAVIRAANDIEGRNRLLLCRRPIDGCHCERSEAISILRRPEIATSAFGGLAMTTPQIKSDIALPCGEAFRLAERFGVKKLEIRRICDAHKIKICNCQLGCFK